MSATCITGRRTVFRHANEGLLAKGLEGFFAASAGCIVVRSLCEGSDTGLTALLPMAHLIGQGVRGLRGARIAARHPINFTSANFLTGHDRENV